jgi:hypothetical protein
MKGASAQAKGASKEGFIAHFLLLGIQGIWGISFIFAAIQVVSIEGL